MGQLGADENFAHDGASMSNDKFDILERLNRYILSIDTHDDAPFVDNFHDDGEYVSPFGTASGREQIFGTNHAWHAGDIPPASGT